MEKKFIDRKEEAENQIHDILESFKKDTGVSINYVDFSEKNTTGFDNKVDNTFKTKIIIKND